jgi:hypothetical protein
MIMDDSISYTLTLNTGEKISVVEFNDENLSSLNSQLSLFIPNIMNKIDRIPHNVLQEAKLGYARKLEKLIRNTPVKCLLQIDKPICSEIKTCSIADRQKCRTSYKLKSLAAFPVCWEYEVPGEASIEVKNFAGNVVYAWRSGNYVFISVTDQM